MSDPAWRRTLLAFAQPSALSVFFFGFGCGLPFLLVGYTLSIRLREAGFDLGAIGLVSYISLLYTFKFVWSPWLDWRHMPLFGRLGRRRGWLVVAQLLVGAALAAMAVCEPSPASFDGFLVLMALAAFAGATQATVVDAFRIEIAPPEQQGALAATYSFGYRLGLICGGAGALYLADVADWRSAYLAMAALMAAPVVATLLSPEPAEERVAATLRAAPASLDAFVGPFVEFFRRNGLALALLLIAPGLALVAEFIEFIDNAFYVSKIHATTPYQNINIYIYIYCKSICQ